MGYYTHAADTRGEGASKLSDEFSPIIREISARYEAEMTSIGR